MVMHDYAKRQKREVRQKYILNIIPVESVWIAVGLISLPITLCYMFIKLTGGF